MKTTLYPVIVLAGIIIFFKTATAQVYDYENDSISKPMEKKVYPAIILNSQDFRTSVNMRYRYDTIPVSRQPSLRVDSTSTYFRMMERMQRLPGNEQWKDDEMPNLNPKVGSGGYMRRKRD